MRSAFHDILIDCPVIAAVKDDEDWKNVLSRKVRLYLYFTGI